jgi:hypothetical protein
VRVWVEDVKYHVVVALRAVGIGVIIVAWASALASEAQQVSDTRAYVEVAAAVIGLIAVHALTHLPPSWTVTDLLKPLERDITAIARERARGDARVQMHYIGALRALATERVRGGANIPRDRRGWLRGLLRLAEADQTRN